VVLRRTRKERGGIKRNVRIAIRKKSAPGLLVDRKKKVKKYPSSLNQKGGKKKKVGDGCYLHFTRSGSWRKRKGKKGRKMVHHSLIASALKPRGGSH